MPEPYRTRFAELIRAGAASVDIVGDSRTSLESDAFVARELRRPHDHAKNICAYLQRLNPARILDVGCGTGALCVALAATFPDATVVGVDPGALALDAARVRASAQPDIAGRMSLIAVAEDSPLPFVDRAFDLVTCTSVLEFLTAVDRRRRLARELTRVARGRIVITTPNPLCRMREQHSRRWFGDFRRRADAPWASRPGELEEMFAPWERLPVPERVRDKLSIPALPAVAAHWVERIMPWQFLMLVPPRTPAASLPRERTACSGA